MPGFTTHYLFGQQTYLQLKNSYVKETIHKYPKVFALGLQGPDIFFYDLTSFIRGKQSPGSLLHTTETHNFLKHLLKSSHIFPTEKEQQIALAYTLGFIGHYLLDTTCHPYIYAMTKCPYAPKDGIGDHIQLETDIDADLLWHFRHKLPSEFPHNMVLKTTLEEKRIISHILYHAFLQTYPKFSISKKRILLAIYSIEKGTRLLYDPRGYKKTLIRKIERHYLGYYLLSSLVPSDILIFHKDPCNRNHALWRNPWDESLESNESFLELFEKARHKYLLLLNETESSLLTGLGNYSYHSGLLSSGSS